MAVSSLMQSPEAPACGVGVEPEVDFVQGAEAMRTLASLMEEAERLEASGQYREAAELTAQVSSLSKSKYRNNRVSGFQKGAGDKSGPNPCLFRCSSWDS